MTLSRRALLLGAGSVAALAACAKTVTRTEPPPPVLEPATTAAPPVTAPAAARGPARFVRSGPTASPKVALTFHGDGDVAVVDRLLATARQVRVPITVFAVGQWLDANPAMAARLRDDGHELANHTYTHPGLGRLGRSAVATEITGCRDVLNRLSGSPGPWFRPSGIETPTQLMLDEAGAAGYGTVVGYDVDPLDYTDPGAAEVIRATTAGLHPGAIISLHTGHSGTVAAFAPIVAAITAAGLEPVLLSDLLRP
ncbi:MAG: polysaccharide deacetylase family protein [Acidimicrobiales bacterium]